MDVPDSAAQAGSIRLQLASSEQSSSTEYRFAEWTEISNVGNTPFAFSSPEHVSLFASLVKLSGGHVGRQPHRRQIIHTYCKTYQDSLVVRVYVTPCVGPFDPLKASYRKDLEAVLGKLVRRWEWVDDEGQETDEEELVFGNKDFRQMTSLYQTIPSPTPRTALSKIKDTATRRTIQRILAEGETGDVGVGSAAWAFDGDLKALGMTTDLYGYQRRSVAQMLLQESYPERFRDIKFVQVQETGRDGTYYVDLRTGEVRREEDVGFYEVPRGGILCEEMGTGKTLIALTLVLATSQQRTTPDTEKPHSEVLTHMGTTLYPRLPGLQREGVAPLTDLALHRHVSSRSGRLPISSALPPLRDSFLHTLAASHPHYYETVGSRDCGGLRALSGRDRQRDDTVKVYLSTATLIIVPRLLLKQWEGEIKKHFVEGALIYIVVDRDLPSGDQVMKSDIVLMTDARESMRPVNIACKSLMPGLSTSHLGFRAAEKEMRLNAQGRGGLDIFSHIRWKRVVVDEGHVASTGSGALMTLARKTCSQAFWAVSGTPTKHALSSDSHFENASTSASPWGQGSIQDLRRLLGIMTNLLQMKPFDIEGKSVDTSANTLVVKPLADKVGPCYGAIKRIEKLIHLVMVRTREGDIASEVVLPPCDERNQGMDLYYEGHLTYNVLQAMFAANAILSERVGPDYLLTPSNKSALLLASRNIQLACCWFPSSNEEMNPRSTLDELETVLSQPAKMAALSESDQRMGLQAAKWLEIAANDDDWRKMINKISIPIRVALLFPDILRGMSISSTTDGDISLTTAEIPLALRYAASTIADPNAISGTLIKAAHTAKRHQPQLVAQPPKPAKKKKNPEQSVVAGSKSRSASKSLRRSEKAATHEQDLDTEEVESLQHIPVQLKKRERSGRGIESANLPQHAQVLRVPPEVRALEFSFNTVSSKLDWIIAEVLGNEEDRYLVFAKDSVMLGQLTECLDLVGISSCYVGTGSNVRAREAAIDLFQQKRRRVCLMEVELAGRGLNLIVANRVIFVEPVWKEDLQRQAIARIYRIGQDRPTRCDILYIKGSQEQETLQRRHGSRAQNAEDDDMIQRSIAYPRFLQTIAPPCSPFVTKLLDPAWSHDDASHPVVDSALEGAGEVKDRQEGVAVPQHQRDHDSRPEYSPTTTKRARLASNSEEDTVSELRDTPPVQRQEDSTEETPPRHAYQVPEDDHKPTQDSGRPRKKVKVAFAPSDDA